MDDDPNIKFVGAFIDEVMVGCATLQYDPREEADLRIRGMAVDPDHRNMGIGSNLVGMLQDYAIELGTGYGAMLE